MTHRIAVSPRSLGIAAAFLITLTPAVSSQSLARRVADARGTVAFEYATRPNVCGDGSSIMISDDSSAGWTLRSRRSGVHIGTRTGDRSERCEVGPARVVLRRDGAEVVNARVTVGGRRESADSDLGEVPPAEAAAYLLDLAPRLDGRSADQAIMSAEIAEGTVVWRRLLQIARANDASESARKAAVFWISHEASVAATAGLDSLAADDDVALSVRRDALFHLAHRPDGEGIPALLRVAESSRNVKLRRDAIWFLAQSRDSRALALFEKLLAGR